MIVLVIILEKDQSSVSCLDSYCSQLFVHFMVAKASSTRLDMATLWLFNEYPAYSVWLWLPPWETSLGCYLDRTQRHIYLMLKDRGEMKLHQLCPGSVKI